MKIEYTPAEIEATADKWVNAREQIEEILIDTLTNTPPSGPNIMLGILARLSADFCSSFGNMKEEIPTGTEAEDFHTRNLVFFVEQYWAMIKEMNKEQKEDQQ